MATVLEQALTIVRLTSTNLQKKIPGEISREELTPILLGLNTKQERNYETIALNFYTVLVLVQLP
jgi:hypothetical protein